MNSVFSPRLSLVQLLTWEVCLPQATEQLSCAVRAVEQIRKMRGGSQSHLMRCSDGHYYVVKFQNNPQHIRILANEFLGTALAKALGLPTSPFSIVYVSPDLIDLTPELSIELPRWTSRCESGFHFGSRYIGNPKEIEFLPPYYDIPAEVLKHFAGMLVFDKWTCNADWRQLLFDRSTTSNTISPVMIDQGFCFNQGEWNFPDSAIRGVYPDWRVYGEIRGIDDFEPWLSRLESELDLGSLWGIADNIPPAWYEDDRDALAFLLAKLDRRRLLLRDALYSLNDTEWSLFPRWGKSPFWLNNTSPRHLGRHHAAAI